MITVERSSTRFIKFNTDQAIIQLFPKKIAKKNIRISAGTLDSPEHKYYTETSILKGVIGVRHLIIRTLVVIK